MECEEGKRWTLECVIMCSENRRYEAEGMRTGAKQLTCLKDAGQ